MGARAPPAATSPMTPGADGAPHPPPSSSPTFSQKASAFARREPGHVGLARVLGLRSHWVEPLRPRRPLRWQRWASGAGAVLVAGRAMAEGRAGAPPIAGVGSCPEPALVAEIVRTIMSPTAGAPQVPVTVADRGDSYVVDVGGR